MAMKRGNELLIKYLPCAKLSNLEASNHFMINSYAKAFAIAIDQHIHEASEASGPQLALHMRFLMSST